MFNYINKKCVNFQLEILTKYSYLCRILKNHSQSYKSSMAKS